MFGSGLGFWRYAATYAPLGPGNFFVPYGPDGRNVRTQSTDLGDELYIDGPAGTEAQVLVALENDGSHGLTIQRFPRSINMVTNVQWSPYVARNGSDITGESIPLRQLPASIPPHQTIRIVLTLRKPRCVPGGFENTQYVTLLWYALGAHHEYDMPLSPDNSTTFVGCPHYLPHRSH